MKDTPLVPAEKPSGSRQETPADVRRKTRQAVALRENLLRRKQQVRARSALDVEAWPPETVPSDRSGKADPA